MYLTFAWRYFKAKKSTNAINIIAWVTAGVIAFATCCQVLVLSVFNGLEDLVRSLYSSFYTDIKVMPAKGKTFVLTPAQLAGLKQQPYVSYASLVAEDKALLQNPGADDAQSVIYLKGVDSNYIHITGVAEKTRGQFDLGTLDKPGIVVGSGVQDAAAINIGPALGSSDLVVILPKKNVADNHPLESLSEGIVSATGVFTIQQEFDNKYAISNIDFVKQQMNFSADEYSAVELKVRSGSNLKEVQEKLGKFLGPGYDVQTRYQQNSSLYDTMRLEKWAIYAVFTLVLVVSAFTMISALTMLVLEKKKDISVLLSMGVNRSVVQKIFLSEGLLLAGIGAVTGIAMAVLICLLQLQFKFLKLSGGSFLIDYFPVKLLFTDLLLVTATAVLIAFFAAWLPAYKASRQQFELK